MSYCIQHNQATVVWLHSCSLELKTLSKSSSELLQPTFHRSDNTNVNVGMDVKDLLEG